MTLTSIHVFCEVYESLSGFGTTSSWHINFTVQAYGSKAMVMAIIEIYTAPFKDDSQESLSKAAHPSSTKLQSKQA